MNSQKRAIQKTYTPKNDALYYQNNTLTPFNLRMLPN